MRPAGDPLTEPQIHAAIRALDAGDRPARATLRTALLMALAWHAAQAEIAALRAGLGGWRHRHTLHCQYMREYDQREGLEQLCRCGADEHNAQIDALLGEPQAPGSGATLTFSTEAGDEEGPYR
jgi:hypothetical protein